jgi:hypothetical protein
MVVKKMNLKLEVKKGKEKRRNGGRAMDNG